MDLSALLICVGLIVLAIGEVLAVVGPGLTISERIRAWVGASVGRKTLLAVGLAALFLHLAFSWPW